MLNNICEEDSRKAKRKGWRRDFRKANKKGDGICPRKYELGMTVAWNLSGGEKNSTSRRPLTIRRL